MKRISLLAVAAASLLVLGSAGAAAQSRYTDAGATSKFSLGLGVAPGIAVPIGTLDEGDGAGLGFAFRGGLNATLPLSNEFSVFLNTGIDMRNLGVKEDTLLDSRFYQAQYFYIQPGISYSSLGISVNIGVPMGGSEPVPRFTGHSVPVDQTQDVDAEAYELMIEPRLNGTLVLMDAEDYWLGLDISVGLPLNTLYKEEFHRPEAIDDGRTLVPAAKALSAHLGLTFQFGLFDSF